MRPPGHFLGRLLEEKGASWLPLAPRWLQKGSQLEVQICEIGLPYAEPVFYGPRGGPEALKWSILGAPG